MDTTEKYIKMCEKAEEIQQIVNRLEQNYYSVHKDIIAPFLISSEGHEYNPHRKQMFQFVSYTGKINYDVVIFLGNYPPLSDHLLTENVWKDRLTWLPRQDQLQKMVKEEDKRDYLLMINFRMWINKTPYNYRQLSNMSMEQLWLAFVMDDKYGKTWDEEKEQWIASSKE